LSTLFSQFPVACPLLSALCCLASSLFSVNYSVVQFLLFGAILCSLLFTLCFPLSTLCFPGSLPSAHLPARTPEFALASVCAHIPSSCAPFPKRRKHVHNQTHLHGRRIRYHSVKGSG
jgi:hypothetical protein